MSSDDLVKNLDFSEYCESLAGLRIETPAIQTRNSRLYKGVLPPSGQRVAVKHVAGPARATLEFESLSNAHRAMNERYGVARPICLIADHGLLLMEWIEGRSVYEHLTRTDVPFEDALGAAAASGRWLRRFHESSELGTAPIDFAAKLTQIERLHESMSRRPLRQRSLGWMRKRLRADATGLRNLRLMRAQLHGDFKPHNILVNGHGTFAIDFGHIYESTVWNDAAFFLAQLEWAVICSGRLGFLLRLPALRRGFLQAYEEDQPTCPPAALSWLEREVLYRFAHQHLERPRLRLRNLAALLIIFAMFFAHRRSAAEVS